MKVLFITANRVGDAVLTTGLLARLVADHPGARITIACGPYAADLFRAVPGLQRLIIMRKRSWNRHWIALWRACRGTRWDLIVDLRNSVVSRLLRARRRVCHTRGTGAHKVVDNAAVLGLAPPPDPFIWTVPEAEAEAARLIPAGQRVLALGPAANWPPKQWPIGSYVALTRALTGPGGALDGADVMVIADGHERDQVAPLLAAVPDARRIELIGGSLQVAAACLRRAALYVGNDSGLMHLAAACGAPTVGLFGPGYPDIYGPWGPRCVAVTTPESREELLARLPDISARAPNLMGGLAVTKVVAAAAKLLGAN